jgi:hypothetical protein
MNECHLEDSCDLAEETCVNTPGSFYCECNFGFMKVFSHDRYVCEGKFLNTKQNKKENHNFT